MGALNRVSYTADALPSGGRTPSRDTPQACKDQRSAGRRGSSLPSQEGQRIDASTNACCSGPRKVPQSSGLWYRIRYHSASDSRARDCRYSTERSPGTAYPYRAAGPKCRICEGCGAAPEATDKETPTGGNGPTATSRDDCLNFGQLNRRRFVISARTESSQVVIIEMTNSSAGVRSASRFLAPKSVSSGFRVSQVPALRLETKKRPNYTVKMTHIVNCCH